MVRKGHELSLWGKMTVCGGPFLPFLPLNLLSIARGDGEKLWCKNRTDLPFGVDSNHLCAHPPETSPVILCFLFVGKQGNCPYKPKRTSKRKVFFSKGVCALPN